MNTGKKARAREQSHLWSYIQEPPESYEYSPLPRETLHIRIPELYPTNLAGNWRISIWVSHAELHTFPFMSKALSNLALPKYDAVSYIWGNPQKTHAIKLAKKCPRSQMMHTERCKHSGVRTSGSSFG